jgi:allantoin racemase
MKIRIIVPVATDRFNEEVRREFKAYANPDTEIDVVNLDKGPESIESEYDEVLAAPDILNKAKEAEKQGLDGIIIDCFGDPGVRAAREIVNIPVIGAGQPSMLLASMLGQKFSVVTVLKNVAPMIYNLAKIYGVYEKLASVRYINIPVLELADKVRVRDAIYGEMVKAVENDEAHVLVLGCTGMMGLSQELCSMLKEKGYDVPVVDPAASSLKIMEAMVKLKVKQSKETYMPPPTKPRKI